MSKSFRVRTKPGDDGYIKVNVDLEQNFDFLEILSLKISQVEDYQNFCADYGVVAGRIVINNGFGVPNVKVSIFVPIEESDVDNEVINEIYPYTAPTHDQKNGKGVRYNILPNQQQNLDHTPVGTFPEKREILDNDTTLEIYEKYYKYTTTTNESGDYILFGVPLGAQTLHYDMDISDIGFLSTRPYELMAQGYSEDLFENRFKFKSSENLDSLPQIFSQNIPITVEPYWCDSLSIGSILGINRKDIFIDNIELIPSAIFLGSTLTDDEKDSINKNCRADRDMGKMDEVITNQGKIEAIRRNIDGGIETFNLPGDAVDENGNWSVLLPMNMRKVITDEFGMLIPSPDGIKGVATEGDYRFRVSVDQAGSDKRLRERAKFLVPNLTGNYVFKTYSFEDLRNSKDFKINKQLSTFTLMTPYEDDLTNQYNYLEDFYTFRWKKVYTVKQYIGRYQKMLSDETRSFIGMKDVLNGMGVNSFPTNRADTSVHPLYMIICFLLSLFGHLVGLINGILMIVNGLITMLCQLKIPVGLSIRFSFCIRAIVTLCNSNWKADYGHNSTSPYNPWKCSCKSKWNACCKCKRNGPCSKDGAFYVTAKIKWKCILAPLLCNKCRGYCDGGEHGCCRSGNSNCNQAYGGCSNKVSPILPSNISNPGCSNESFTTSDLPGNEKCCKYCCIKIPLIKLKCGDEPDKVWQPTIIPTPFAGGICNETWVIPFSCLGCGGLQTPQIKDWVSCVMEPIAVWLKMLKFDFYNDWVSGSLYFPLIKRKLKVKKRKKKFGQIKKDKFCDFDCKTGLPYTPPIFQGPPSYTAHRIRIHKPLFLFPSPSVTVAGCTAKIRGNLTTNWYGSITSNQTENLNNAALEIVLKGKNSNGDRCEITFEDYAQVIATLPQPL